MSDFGVQLGLFEPADLDERANTPAPTMTHLVVSDDAFAQLLRQVEVADRVTFDTETTGVDMTRCGLVGVSVCTHPGEGWYLLVDLDPLTRASGIWLPQGPHLALKASGYRSQLTLQVHDELVLDVPDEEVPEVRKLLRREMEHAAELTAPLKVEASVGPNWDAVA